MQDSEDKWQGGKLVSWMLVRKLGLAVSSTSHGRGIRRLLLNLHSLFSVSFSVIPSFPLEDQLALNSTGETISINPTLNIYFVHWWHYLKFWVFFFTNLIFFSSSHIYLANFIFYIYIYIYTHTHIHTHTYIHWRHCSNLWVFFLEYFVNWRHYLNLRVFFFTNLIFFLIISYFP